MSVPGFDLGVGGGGVDFVNGWEDRKSLIVLKVKVKVMF